MRTKTEGGVKAHVLEEFCDLSQNEQITNSVKSVLPDHLLLCHLRVERVSVDVRGMALVWNVVPKYAILTALDN